MTRAIKVGFGSAIGVVLGIVTILILTSLLFASCTAMVVKHEANAMRDHVTNQQPNVISDEPVECTAADNGTNGAFICFENRWVATDD